MANHIPPHIQTLLRKHPTWAELSAKYILHSETGVTMQEFCSIEKLPIEEFSKFHAILMEDLQKEFDNNPFLRKISRLPAKEQNRYTELSGKRRDAMQKMCNAVGKILGERVEIKDLFSNDGDMDPALDHKLKKVLEDPTKIAPSLSAEFMISTLEVSKAESEIDKFLTRHKI